MQRHTIVMTQESIENGIRRAYYHQETEGLSHVMIVVIRCPLLSPHVIVAELQKLNLNYSRQPPSCASSTERSWAVGEKRRDWACAARRLWHAVMGKANKTKKRWKPTATQWRLLATMISNKEEWQRQFDHLPENYIDNTISTNEAFPSRWRWDGRRRWRWRLATAMISNKERQRQFDH